MVGQKTKQSKEIVTWMVRESIFKEMMFELIGHSNMLAGTFG